MAEATKEKGVSVITTNYMRLLRSLCRTTSAPSLAGVAAIFEEFRYCLSHGTAEHPSSSSSHSSRASTKRVGNSVRVNNAGFERSCTWVPDKERCWIVSDRELWNSILVLDNIELLEHTWGELRLQGYEGSVNNSEHQNVLRASFLVHLLLRQHRCVTYIILDMTTTVLERSVLLHGIRTGAAGVKLLEIKSPSFDKLTAAENTWPRAVARLKNLVHLCICSAYSSTEIAHTLGVYVEQAHVLTTLLLVDIKVNKTLETLAFDMTSTPSKDELSNLFALVQRIGVFSRLRFNWINPRGSDFAKGAMTSQRSFEHYKM
ncbi:hypothetical protein HPB52_015476 [Rhipicephalus sanguineus]|uniref:Uncharacterized protein n=1 Tax=Rhipicephalus sanguineus TaxID=34632 RepID=A0A9D4QEZ7_RHISA|nr:hypothetical protein HPB52_015476 [Rhipicephalus sanguineus]